MPMVFISHSSERSADPVRKEIQRQLKERGWEVRVDDALRGGDEWKSVLYNWLADCDAAIVIIGRNAIESRWVKREANLLLWRYGLRAPITIIPVLLADVSGADVRNSELSEVLDFQVVKAPSENLTPGEVQELVGRVVERLPDISGALPSPDCDGMRRWLADVISCLREVNDEAALQTAVRALNVAGDWHFPSVGEGRRFLAYQMLAPDLAGHVHLAVIAIARQAAAQLAQLVPLVMPTWVDGEAARLLLPNGRQQVFAFLNARRAETAEHYVQRAACCSLSYRARPVTLIAGEEQQLEFMQACEVAVRRLLDLAADDSLEGVEPLEGEVGFLVVDPDNTPIDVAVDALRPLLARFGWLNVILLTGESCPDPALVARGGLEGVILRPELASSEERDAARTVRRLRDLQQELTGR